MSEIKEGEMVYAIWQRVDSFWHEGYIIVGGVYVGDGKIRLENGHIMDVSDKYVMTKDEYEEFRYNFYRTGSLAPMIITLEVMAVAAGYIARGLRKLRLKLRG